MAVEVDGSDGFAVLLNRNAQIGSIVADGRPAKLDFQNGFLWVGLPRGSHRLSIDYDIIVERPEKGGNSSAFANDAGHVRNQYYWHPFFGFGEERDRARFSVQATIPAEYRLVLDIPQTESVVGDRRIVHGDSPSVEAMTIAYDKKWKPRELEAEGIRLTLWASDDFQPSVQMIQQAFSRAARVSTAKFGHPATHEIKIVQTRELQGGGWRFSSDQGIFAGIAADRPTQEAAFPVRLFFGHEVSHLWTHPTGWARNLLAEGWATYAESLILADEFPPDVVRQFWRDQARLQIVTPAAMSTPLREDSTNSGVSYHKGSWVLKMLERTVGREHFASAIRAFASRSSGQTGYNEFLAGLGDKRAAARFLDPWISHAGLPDLNVRIEDGSLVIIQGGAPYWLPHMSLRLVHLDGSVETIFVDVESSRTVVSLHGPRAVTVELDPDEDYLLPRRLFTV